MRAGFDEHAVPGAARVTHRPLELNRLPDAAEPVVGVESRGVQRLAGHGGEQRDRGRPRLDSGQRLGQRGADRVDVPGVGGVVDVDPAGPHVAALTAPDQLVERLHLTGHHHRGNTVDRSDIQPIAERGDQLFGPGQAAGQRHHAAGARQPHQQPAAQRHHPGGVLQGQRPRDIGRRDLALRMADHRIGNHAQRAPQLRQRHHHRPQGRLHDVHPVQPGRAGRPADDVDQGPVHVFGERLLAALQVFGENR